MVEYWFTTEVERNYDANYWHNVFLEHWTDSFVYSAIYLILVFAGRKVMQHRQKFDLHKVLAVWSGSMAVFSLIGFLRVFPKLLEEYNQGGWQRTLCDQSFMEGVSGFWSLAFTLSKVAELFDTMFIVLRKQKLVFLHWYHHVTVLIYTWYAFTDGIPYGIYFHVMNYGIHALMYSYYAIRASRLVKIPVQINIAITFLQLCQMIVGIYLNIYAYFKLENTKTCPVYYNNIYWSLAMYYTYFLLFSHFFYSTYMAPGKGKPELKTEKVLHNGFVSKKLN
uniref:Elongation of very long chain fatty acids protein n=1 Tax=Saccoglossus kowalevskii TaxID=10224 RepID=A0ABM0M8K1_SACKO|nr:PREDICTED: elongation of very long chain fatty acids protein 6-like [Saccoglossus kowalevskii]